MTLCVLAENRLLQVPSCRVHSPACGCGAVASSQPAHNCSSCRGKLWQHWSGGELAGRLGEREKATADLLCIFARCDLTTMSKSPLAGDATVCRGSAPACCLSHQQAAERVVGPSSAHGQQAEPAACSKIETLALSCSASPPARQQHPGAAASSGSTGCPALQLQLGGAAVRK